MAVKNPGGYIDNGGFRDAMWLITRKKIKHKLLQKMKYQRITVVLQLIIAISFWMTTSVQASTWDPDGYHDESVNPANPSNPAAEILLDGLEDARSVRISALGNIFIVETGRNRIIKTDANGIRVDSIGRLGAGDYQFDLPVAIDPTNELKIYIADRNNRRIQVFDRRLQYLSTIKMPQRAGLPSRYQPRKLTVDSSGRIYFFDEDRHVVYRFDSNGHYELDFELFSEEERIIPVSMTILDDVLWIAGQRGELLHRFTTRGSYIGFMYAPEAVRALRSTGGYLWMLGTERVLQLGSGGEILFAKMLPSALRTDRRRGPDSDQRYAEWQSFDVRDDMIYLLNTEMLARVSSIK